MADTAQNEQAEQKPVQPNSSSAPVPAAAAPLHLSINSYSLETIPPEQDILKAGLSLILESPSWTKGKSFVNGTVSTTSKKDSKSLWFARHSTHKKSELPFDDFWQGLGVNKAENEREFIPTLNSVKLMHDLSPTRKIWNIYYVLQKPLSPRIYTVLQVTSLTTNEENGSRQGLIVSLPITLSGGDEGSVRARYVSVELLQESPDREETLWRMAVSTDVGGLVPKFVVHSNMPKEISDDVPFFIKWWKEKTAKEAVEAPKPADSTALVS